MSVKIKSKNKILSQVQKELLENKDVDIQYKKRLLVIKDIINGEHIDDCCKSYNIGKSTIYKWIEKVNKNGISELKKKQGTKKKLTEEQEKNIIEITDNPATEYAYKTSLWTGQMVVDLIKNKYNINVTERYAQKLLKKYNYSFNNIDEHSVIKILEELEDIIDDNDNVWYIIYFMVWEKKRHSKKESIQVFSKKNSYYFMALNYYEGKIFLVEKKDIFNIERLYGCLTEFMEAFLYKFIKEKNNIIIMSNSPINRRLVADINQSRLEDYNFQIFSYKLDNYKENVIHEEFNPLYTLKLKIQNVVDDYATKCKFSFNDNIKEKINKIIKECLYDLY